MEKVSKQTRVDKLCRVYSTGQGHPVSTQKGLKEVLQRLVLWLNDTEPTVVKAACNHSNYIPLCIFISWWEDGSQKWHHSKPQGVFYLRVFEQRSNKVPHLHSRIITQVSITAGTFIKPAWNTKKILSAASFSQCHLRTHMSLYQLKFTLCWLRYLCVTDFTASSSFCGLTVWRSGQGDFN